MNLSLIHSKHSKKKKSAVGHSLGRKRLMVTENNISLATRPLSPAESQALTLWVTTHKPHGVIRGSRHRQRRETSFLKRELQTINANLTLEKYKTLTLPLRYDQPRWGWEEAQGWDIEFGWKDQIGVSKKASLQTWLPPEETMPVLSLEEGVGTIQMMRAQA